MIDNPTLSGGSHGLISGGLRDAIGNFDGAVEETFGRKMNEFRKTQRFFDEKLRVDASLGVCGCM